MSHYHIPLLRDLHDHFPDLLYRPERFRSVSDVLQYVIRVANQSPYRRGRQQFMNSFEEPPVRSPSFMPFPAPTMPSAPLAPAPSAPSAPSAPPAPAVSSLSHMVFDIFSDANGPSSMDPQLIQFLGSLGSVFQNMEAPIGASAGSTGLTSDIITRSTHLETAQQTQEDQCAICQDHMTEGQSLRTILHCHHLFHQTCIDVWFQTHATCPTCRHRLS